MTSTTGDDPRTLVSTAWLARHLDDPDLRVLDGSWYLPGEGRDARAEHREARIPGARFADLDALSDPDAALPHMAPDPDALARMLGALGVGDGDRVVVYDGAGLFSAARIWWLLRLVGVTEAAVLDGGLPKWRAEDRPTEAGETGEAEPTPATLAPDPRPALARDADEIAGDGAARQIVDARSPARFAGETEEPRPGLRAGHLPGSLNLPYSALIAPGGTMKEPDALRAAFAEAGIDLSRPVTTTCGSGVTAAILALALARLGHEDWALYDGSWSDWGGSDRPIETGPPDIPAKGA